MFASLASPKSCFTVCNKQGFHKRFSNRVRLFTRQYQVRLHMMPVLVETSGKINLGRLKLAAYRRQNFLTSCGVIGMLCI